MAIGGKNTMELIIAARDRTRGAFTKVGAQMKGTTGSATRLNGAMNALKGGMSGAASSIISFGAALGPAGIAVAAVAVGVATLGGAALKASLEFEKAFATIRVGTGATGDTLAGLEDSFKTVFTEVPTTTAAAATAIADLNTRLGLTGEPLEALATQFLNLSRITGTDVAASISSATRVMHDFDVSTKDQAAALDYLFKVSQSTGLGMTQLGNSMTQYGSVMRQMGFNINESAALLGKFEKEGVNLELVLGSLRMGLANFAKAGEEPVEALQRVITEIQGMGSVADANLKAIEIFGSRAGPDMAAAIREGRFSISELMATLDASSETINNAAENTMQFGDKWKLFKNQITAALVPAGDAIKNVLGKAIEGLGAAFSVLQKAMKPVFDLMFIQFTALHAFLEGLFEPIMNALKPLSGIFGDTSGAVSKLNIVLKVMKDVFTIITGVAGKLGTILGTLLAKAITPLVAKIKEGITTLTEFYNKLGPIKGLIEGIKDKVGAGADAIGKWADSFTETVPPVEELTEAVSELTEEAKTMVPILSESIKTLESSLTEASGNYKTAIDDISKEIDTLKDAWNLASDDQKAAIEKQIDALEDIKSELEDGEEAQKAYFDNVIEGTEEAAEAQKEFKVTIGDTTITFKDMAAEVIKNADAYADLQKNAEALLDLDWSVFTKLEADLPNIDTGIKSMSDAFSGLKGVLEDNIEELENVKESVMAIGEIAAPFIEEGFIESISAISSFGGALSDAGGAINTFTNLQDVSTEGAKEFSSRIHNMVSALEILEDQMEDLVPSFEAIGDLSTSIAENFLGGAEYIEETGEAAEYLANQFKNINEEGSGWDIDPWGHQTHGQLVKLLKYMGATDEQARELIKSLGPDLQIEMVKLAKESNTASEFINKLNNSSLMLNVSVDIATIKLKEQTGQLKKITDALAPYLNFMRTLSELSALSTLSVEELNNGFKAIEETLTNLSDALTKFDLKSVMESSFNAIKNFTDSWEEATSEMGNSFETFENILNIISRLSSGIIALSKTFVTLKETTIISARDMDKAMQNIDLFITHFTKALSLNLDSLVDSLVDLDIEWSRHAKEMENIMPSYKDASSSIGTLLGPLASLSSALKELSEMGAIAATTFDTGFAALITSIGNFAISLRKNVDPLIGSLKTLRTVWVENEVVLVPLMLDLIIIAKSFTSVAANVNNMVIAFDTLSKNSGSLEKGFKTLIKFIDQVKEATKKFYTPESARAIKQYIIDIALVIAAFRNLSRQLETATSNVEKEVTTTVNNIARSILSLKSLIPSMFAYGAGMMFSFISGINAWIPVLEAQLIGIAAMIRGYLGVESPTRLGPLRALNEWPKNLVRGFSEGIKSEMGTLNSSFGNMALTAPGSGGSSGNVTHISFSVTQHITDVASAKVATNELERMLQRHEML